MKSKFEIIGLGMFTLVLTATVVTSLVLMVDPLCDFLLAVLAFVG